MFNTANMIDKKKEAGWSMDIGVNKPGEDLTWLV